MLRYLLLLILFAIVARAFWRIVDGVLEGMRGAPPQAGRAPRRQRRVPMARDPVCGTFVVRDRAITIGAGDRRLYFCSAACRDKYQARTA